jgi:hypothetical protein
MIVTPVSNDQRALWWRHKILPITEGSIHHFGSNTRRRKHDMSTTISRTAKEEAEEAAWRAAADREHPDAPTPVHAWERQASEDWQSAWAAGAKAPRGAKALAERRRKAALAEIARMKEAGNLSSPEPVPEVSPQEPTTADFVAIPKKRGRPSISGRAMTVAERSSKRRTTREIETKTALSVLLNLAFSYATIEPRKTAFKVAGTIGAEKLSAVERTLKAHGFEKDFGWFEDMFRFHMPDALEHLKHVREKEQKVA